MDPRPDLRVGDAERDAAATALQEHFAQGRLTSDELSERLEAAFGATTRGDLAQLTSDLPELPPAPAPPPAHSGADTARAVSRTAGRAVAAAVLLAAFVALLAFSFNSLRTGHHGPNIPALIIGLLILRGLAGRVFGHQHHHRRMSHPNDSGGNGAPGSQFRR